MSHGWTIRQATTEDASQMHEVHAQSVRTLCQEHYTPEQIAGWLKNRTPQGYLPGIKRGDMFVVVDGEKIVGFGHAIPGEVVAVFVAPSHANRGVGRAILAEALRRARRGYHGAIRLDATLNAQTFYEKAGFVVVERKTERRNNASLPSVVMELSDIDLGYRLVVAEQ